MDDSATQDLLQKTDALIAECGQLSRLLQQWKVKNEKNGEVDGLAKLTSMLNAENKFLDKVRNTEPGGIKPSQINSSNVPYLSSLIRALVVSSNVVAVRKAFLFRLDDYTFIEPLEKNFRIDSGGGSKRNGGGGSGGQRSTKQQSARSRESSHEGNTINSNISYSNKPKPTLAVKVDLVADHGTTWHKINAASAWGLIHEFAGMEDDSDDEKEEEEEEEEEKERHSGEASSLQSGANDNIERHHRTRRRPVHVSKETHPDLTLMTRALALASNQNRIHYHHRPQIRMHFTGFQPQENPRLNEMILNAVRVGSVSQSVADKSIDQCLIPVELGPIMVPEELIEQANSVGGLLKNDNDGDGDGDDDNGDDDGDVALKVALDNLSLEASTPTASATTATATSLIPAGNTQSIKDMHLFTETLNLDITTLMALSSSLCHMIKPDPRLLTSPPLILQAQQESEEPLLPIFAKILEGRKRLVMTRAAMERFKIILNLIGGPEEQWRGHVMIHDENGRVSEDEERAASSDDENEDRGGDDGDGGGGRGRGGATWEEIKARWIQGSDWARERGVFGDGPPLIFVIEDYVDPYPALMVAENASSNSWSSQQQQQQQQQQEIQPQQQQDRHQEDGTSIMAHANSSSNSLGSNKSDGIQSAFSRTHPLDRQKRGSSNTELMSHLHTSIFLAGYHNKYTTLTANGFGYRATTRAGGVPEDISVWFHAPRSLAEAKIGKATS